MAGNAGQVLLAASLPQPFVHAVAARHGVVGPAEGPIEAYVEALPSAAARAVRAIVTVGTVRIGARTIEALPRLGLICCRGSGYDGVDVVAARARGVAVTHGPDLNSSSVADLAMGLVVASVRNMHVARRHIEQGLWRDDRIHATLRVRGLTGRRAGIYGMGAIGTKIAQRAAAFEMEVGYHNRRARPDAAYRYFSSLAELARWADVLVVAVRAGPGTDHAVDRDVLAALGPDGFLVNVARGSVVDQAALVDALASGALAGAGLDVYESEPAVPAALLALSRVALTPHMGGDTEEAEEATLRMVLANLDAFFAGRPLLTPVPAA